VLAPDTGVQRWLRGVGFAGAVMKDVLVQQFGSPEDIYDRPSNMYVAGFIGSPTMNFLPATLQRQGGHWAVELSSPQGKALLPLGPVRDPGADGKEVMVGIRPRHFHPSTRADAAALPVKIKVVEPTGADAFAVVQLNDRPSTVRFPPRRLRAPGRDAMDRGGQRGRQAVRFGIAAASRGVMVLRAQPARAPGPTRVPAAHSRAPPHSCRR